MSLVIGTIDGNLARGSLELGTAGSPSSNQAAAREPAGRIGVRYEHGRKESRGWTASAAATWSDDLAFGQVAAGVSLQKAALAKETPDVLEGPIGALAAEAVVSIGRIDSAVEPRVGFQVSAEAGVFALMR